jgi:hypothetical protein
VARAALASCARSGSGSSSVGTDYPLTKSTVQATYRQTARNTLSSRENVRWASWDPVGPAPGKAPACRGGTPAQGDSPLWPAGSRPCSPARTVGRPRLLRILSIAEKAMMAVRLALDAEKEGRRLQPLPVISADVPIFLSGVQTDHVPQGRRAVTRAVHPRAVKPRALPHPHPAAGATVYCPLLRCPSPSLLPPWGSLAVLLLPRVFVSGRMFWCSRASPHQHA